ncbi:MAG: TlpA disulfide reductase family protein [Rubripirellula sp.]|nr:TlpA disulfide reductase family protein [Rubripirellula sp.]
MSDASELNNGNPGSQTSIWWLVIPLVVVVVAFVLLRGPSLRKQPSPGIGKSAPQIDLIRLGPDSSFERFQRLAERRLTLMHFWGTWCGPCKVEYPELDDVVREFKSVPGFGFISVSCEGSSYETIEGLANKTSEFLRSGNMETTVYADPKGVTRRSVAERLELSSIFYPTSVLIGGDGKIVNVWLGYTPEAVPEIESQIRQRLNL